MLLKTKTDAIPCPVCGSSKYRYKSWSEEGWGTVEQHGFCARCGYTIEQAYSQPIVGFQLDRKRGIKNPYDGKYYPNNVRQRKRLRRKYGIKHSSNDRMLEFI